MNEVQGPELLDETCLTKSMAAVRAATEMEAEAVLPSPPSVEVTLTLFVQ